MVWYPQMLPFVVTVATSILLAGYALRRAEVRAARTFAWLMVCIGIWAGGYALAYCSITLDDKRFWTTLKNLGAIPGPAVWALLALQVARIDALLSRRLWIVITAYVLALLLALFTNPLHHMFWVDMRLVEGVPEAVTTHGPIFKLYEYSIYLATLVSLFAFATHLRRAPRVQQTQALIMIAAALVPVVGRIASVAFGLRPIDGVDSVPLLLFVSGVLFAIALFRYGALDVLSLAHRLVVDHIQAGIVVLDQSERVLGINPFARGLCAEGAGDGTAFALALPACAGMALTDGAEHEVRIDSSGGVERWFLVKVSAVGDDSVGRLGTALMLLEITARKQMERKLVAEATTDPLTGVPNRRRFFALAEREVARAQRSGEPLAVLMLDIDHFKNVNDTWGHGVGDDVLRAVALTVDGTLREIDVFARYGGEEFIALVAGAPAVVAGLAERIRGAVAGIVTAVPGGELKVTASIGSAGLVDGDLTSAIERADDALYEAKRAGRDRCVAAGT